MTPATRTRYFKLWGAACEAQKWPSKSDDLRHQIIGTCMALVHAPEAFSISHLGPDEITALFCYLEHLAHPDDLDRSARWLDCKQDYHAYNRARQADWHERELYGAGANKLDRDRFAGQRRAQGEPLDEFDPEAIAKRHMTFASRHQKKQRALRQPGAQQEFAVNADVPNPF